MGFSEFVNSIELLPGPESENLPHCVIAAIWSEVLGQSDGRLVIVHPQSQGVWGSASSEIIMARVLDHDLDAVFVGEPKCFLDMGRCLRIDVVVGQISLGAVILNDAGARPGRDRAAGVCCLADGPVALSDEISQALHEDATAGRTDLNQTTRLLGEEFDVCFLGVDPSTRVRVHGFCCAVVASVAGEGQRTQRKEPAVDRRVECSPLGGGNVGDRR